MVVRGECQIEDGIVVRLEAEVGSVESRFAVARGLEQPDTALLVTDGDKGVGCERYNGSFSRESEYSLLQLAVQKGGTRTG